MAVAREESWFAYRRAISVVATSLSCAIVGFNAVAGTDCWTYMPPPAGKTQGTLSWTDSSGFENVVQGIKIVSGTEKKLYILESTNGNNTKARNLDFSVGIEDGYELVEIQRSAFNGNSTVTNFVAPSSLVTLARYAFNSCSALVHAELNDGLETIGTYAFAACKALSTIDNFIPSSVKFIDQNAFQNCTALACDLVATGVTNIAARAFQYSAVTSVDLSEAPLDTIGELAFYEMPALTNVILNQNLRSIGREAFRGCTALKTISPLLPTGLQVFGSGDKGVFYGCTALEGDVLWPNSLTNIANRAFYNSKITTFTARGKDIVRFGTHPLYGCTALTNIVLSASIATYDSALMDGCKGGSLERHVWFLGPPPAAFPSQFFNNTDKQFVTLHLPWSQRDAWREWVASGPSGHEFTFNKAMKTLPEHLNDVGTWKAGVTQNVTWWKDVDPHFTITVR